jgi:hypothetical protein
MNRKEAQYFSWETLEEGATWNAEKRMKCKPGIRMDFRGINCLNAKLIETAQATSCDCDEAA